MSTNFIPIDYEYTCSKNKRMEVVSVSYEKDGTTHTIWLYKDYEAQKKHVQGLYWLVENGYVFLAHNCQAEMRAMLSCGLDPKTKVQFVDTFLEYRCLTNHNDNLMWGKQLIGGREVTTFRPNYGESNVNNSKPEHSLASAVYKLLEEKIDTEHKDKIRDIIIANKEVEENKEAILLYNESDIKYLRKMLIKIVNEYKRLLRKDYNKENILKEMLLRGEYGRRSALMEQLGYPVNLEATKNFSDSVEDILSDIARDINKQFDIQPFNFDPVKGRYKMNTKVIKGWIRESKFKNKWLLTPRGDYSLSKDAFTKYFDFTHIYPEGNFGAQIVRYLKTKQNLNGFRPSLSGKKSFWDNVGDDGRVRAFLNPYGSQTARTQPAATGFIPLKAAWMRSLIQPTSGKAMAGLDYGSQEFLISALVSEDKKMIEAYKSGDVYLHFAKSIGMVPEDGTKKTHTKERQICKATVLGISYSMTKIGLAAKLRNDMGDETITEEYAQSLINKFNDTYEDFYEWKGSITGTQGYVETAEGSKYRKQRGEYERKRYLRLPCGWYIWGDNDNTRSVGNFPIQGFGSSIMRKAVALAQDSGLDIPFTLHDAAYMEYDSFDFRKLNVLRDCLVEGFVHYFPEHMKEYARIIRIDGETWSPDYKDYPQEFYESHDNNGEFKVKVEEVHVDERNVTEYEEFKKYFVKDKDLEDL